MNPKERKSRDEKIVRQILSGKSLQAVGDGCMPPLTRERVRQIVERDAPEEYAEQKFNLDNESMEKTIHRFRLLYQLARKTSIPYRLIADIAKCDANSVSRCLNLDERYLESRVGVRIQAGRDISLGMRMPVPVRIEMAIRQIVTQRMEEANRILDVIEDLDEY